MPRNPHPTPLNSPTLKLNPTRFGLGVFAQKTFLTSEVVLEFHGPLLQRHEIPTLHTPEDDRYIQISPTEYLGPSNSYDDFVNHSCNPNCGIQFKKNQVLLIALQPINKNEEITWDYSTTMAEDEWEMDCHCNSPLCRKKIRDFKYLPHSTKKKYINLKIVPSFILQNPPPLLIVDLQPAFKPKKTLIQQIQKKAGKAPLVYQTQFQLGNPLFQKVLKWQPDIKQLHPCLPQFSNLLTKQGYGLTYQQLQKIKKELPIKTMEICGLEIDACILAICFQLWDAKIQPIPLIPLCGGTKHKAYQNLLNRQFGQKRVP